MPRKRRTPASKRLAETDLYRPIYEHLVAQGYTVRSEVEHCDITATRHDELVVIELKRSFGTNLLVQATQRQKVADSVYVALPRPDEWNQAWGRKLHLLKRLELGLILVSFDSGEPVVEVVFHPVPFDRRQRKSARHLWHCLLLRSPYAPPPQGHPSFPGRHNFIIHFRTFSAGC